MLRRTSLLLLLVLAGCSTLPEGQRATRSATGPPEVQQATLEQHAAQFDVEEPERPAGSQQELAASAYIVAHLTEAGYVSRLDAVPVEDLVRSTNVVALPPSGREPETMVVVAYDSTSDSPTGGAAIGVWLEVARALRAVEPDHSVEFVALGAEHTDVGGGHLGSRRLVRQIQDDGVSPHVIVIASDPADRLGAAGHAASELGMSSGASALEDGEVFVAADLDTTTVSGPPDEVGPALLAYLSDL